MKNKTYRNVVATVFIVVAVVHFARISFDWSLQIGEWVVPVWASALAAVIAAALAYQGFKSSKK